MENLIFSLNATVPVFLLMLIGLLFRKIGWMDEPFALATNKFVFRVALPVKLFQDLAKVDFEEAWNARFVGFCMIVTMLSISIAILVSYIWKDKAVRGEFIQASYRSSAALLGIAFIQNIYGNSGMAPMMIIGSVPLYNIMAVLILSFFGKEQKKIDKKLIVQTLKGIIKNPIIIGIVIGLLWSAFQIPLPAFLEKTVSNLAAVATPMGLIAMGATFDIQKAFAKRKPALTATFFKLIGMCTIFLPLAIYLGFRDSELIAILVMLGSATTVSCFVMSKNMGHEGVLSSSVIMLTTMFSAFTLTGWLYILKTMMLI